MLAELSQLKTVNCKDISNHRLLPGIKGIETNKLTTSRSPQLADRSFLTKIRSSPLQLLMIISLPRLASRLIRATTAK